MERPPTNRRHEKPDQRSLEARTRGENERFFFLAARPHPPGRRLESNLDQLNDLLAQGWRVTGAAPPEPGDENSGPVAGCIVLLRRQGGR